jgi:hypothetical protein
MITEQFSDLGCSQSLPILQENMACANFVGRTASFRGFCNEEPSVLPLPSDEFYTQRYTYAYWSGSSTVNRAMLSTLLLSQYDSPTSCGATYEQFESYLPGVCFPLSPTSSIKYSGIDSYKYPNTNCVEQPVVTRLPTNCAPVTVYPNDAVNSVASKWTLGGQVQTGLFNGPGYAWANLYQSKNCQGVVGAQEGFPTNVCLMLYENATNSDPTGSFMYKCNQCKLSLCLLQLYTTCFHPTPLQSPTSTRRTRTWSAPRAPQ